MLAAGIETPAVDELENHLREEIAAQIKSGASQLEAFRLASRDIGQARPLRKEFNKIDTKRRIARTVGLMIGWLAAGLALFVVLFCLYLDWNFFNFDPEWTSKTTVAVLGIVVIEFAIMCLAKASRDWASRVISLIVSLCLVFFAFQEILPPEQITQATYSPGKITVTTVSPDKTIVATILGTCSDPVIGARVADGFARHAPSPFWFRGALTLLCCAPGIFWTFWELRRVIQRRISRMAIQSN